METISNLIFNFFPTLSEYFELPQDQIRVVFCWLSCVPLGFVMKDIKSPNSRHLFALVFGLMLSYIQLREQMLLTVIPSFLSYVLLRWLGKKSDWPTFFLVFGLLGLCNAYRYFYDFYGWNLDGNISLMVMVCKMTYVSFHYCDGRLDHIPSLFEYFSYIYFFPTAFMGPVFEYQTYKDYIYLKGNFNDKYSTKRVAIKNMIYGIIYLFLLTTLEPKMHPRIHYFQEPFLSYNLLQKTAYIFIVGFIQRFRYLGGWRFAQAGLDATGLSYNGKDEKGEIQFDRVLCYKWNYELEYNPIKKTQCWNTNSQTWLKSVFYDRFQMYKWSPSNSLLIVFIISAIWHGIHPAYFLGFAQWAALNDISKVLYKARHKFDWIPKPVQYVLLQITGQLSFTVAGTVMNILDMHKVCELAAHFYYIPLYAPFLLAVILRVTGFGRVPRKQRDQKYQLQQQQHQQQQQSPQNIQNYIGDEQNFVEKRQDNLPYLRKSSKEQKKTGKYELNNGNTYFDSKIIDNNNTGKVKKMI